MSLRQVERQMSMYIPNLEELVRAEHRYCRMLKLVDFEKLTSKYRELYSKRGRAGYAASSGFKALLLQYLEDRSDREMEYYLEENLAAKLFCDFGLKDKTPDHSYFGVLRERIGLEQLSELFNEVREGLKQAGLIREVFTFVDASELRSRVDVWRARDKALEDKDNNQTDDDGNPTMNNKNIDKYTSDSEARFGSKGKSKIWLGYKRHLSVDMGSGLINKVHVSAANQSDAQGLEETCPDGGMVFADKAYCSEPAQQTLRKHNCHSGAILKNNMKGKNRDKDRWLTKVRMPFESVFAHVSKTARYRGREKVQFQAIMQALAFNFKRLLAINAVPLAL